MESWLMEFQRDIIKHRSRVQALMNFWRAQGWLTEERNLIISKVLIESLLEPTLTFGQIAVIFRQAGLLDYNDKDVVALVDLVTEQRGVLFLQAGFKHNPNRYRAFEAIYEVLYHTGQLTLDDSYNLLVGRAGLKRKRGVQELREIDGCKEFKVGTFIVSLATPKGEKDRHYREACAFLEQGLGEVEVFYPQQNALVRKG